MPGNKGGNKGGGGGGGGDNTTSEGGLYIFGRKGRDDHIIGTDKGDVILGRGGDDTIDGGGGNDKITTGDGTDILMGGDGNDELFSGDGDDTLYGGADSDIIQGGEGADIMDGGTGLVEGSYEWDVASFVEILPQEGTSIGLTIEGSTVAGYDYMTSAGDLLVNFEEIVATNIDDLMIGTAGADNYVGARGMDVLIGNGGEDTLYGSLDDDIIFAGTAAKADYGDYWIDGSVAHGNDNAADTLVFLLYAQQYFDESDNITAEFFYGDGYDTVYDFDVATDSILFLLGYVDDGHVDPTPFDPLTMVSYDNGNAYIDYAPDSQITLLNVAANLLTAGNFDFDVVDV